MIKKTVTFTLLIVSFLSFSQDKVKAKTEDKVKTEEKATENQYDRWSIEANVGQNKALRPFSPGYYSSDPTVYMNLNGVEHYDFGVRYMISPYYGFKLDFAYDVIKNNDNGSLPFENNQYRIGFQGVANLARIMQFESFTSRLGLLAHAGIQVSKHAPQMGINKDVSEDNGGVMFGLTPQLRITNSLVFTGDFTVINNVRQHLNWDGSYSAEDNNLTGLMFNTSIGLTFYLGKNEKHADWFVKQEEKAKVDEEARKRLDGIETLMNDTDKDGIADYLDQENNTPAGVAVDSRGKFIDINRNGVPDELERNYTPGSNNNNQMLLMSKEDAIRVLVEKGYVNIFYDVDQDMPNTGSTNNVFYVVQFLRNYPDTTIKLHGFADKRGDEVKNLDLSQRRANNLSKIIIASGIDKDRIEVVGQGVDNSYDDEPKSVYDLARRVSITIN